MLGRTFVLRSSKHTSYLFQPLFLYVLTSDLLVAFAGICRNTQLFLFLYGVSCFLCRHRSLVRTIQELQRNKVLVEAAILPVMPLPAVEEEGRPLPQAPLQGSSSARCSSRKLWRSLQQVPRQHTSHTEIRHLMTLLQGFDFGLAHLSKGSQIYQVRPEPAAAHQGREGGRLLPGQDEPRDVQRPQHVHLQDQQGR